MATQDLQSVQELRLYLEEICSELCRCRHVAKDGLLPEQVTTMREVEIGQSGEFADIKVTPGDAPPYFVEIKWAYSSDEVVERVVRKYVKNPDVLCDKIVIVTDITDSQDISHISALLRQHICPGLSVQIWTETDILQQMAEYFDLNIASLDRGNYREIRNAITRAQWRAAFGGDHGDHLSSTLLWHLSSWQLRRLHQDHGLGPEEILRADVYRDLIIVMADLCSFSSYVRDTRDDVVVRQSLTTFYSQARQAVLESNGMMDKFVGDEVIGIFGFPNREAHNVEDALKCAFRLIDIGKSVSKHWQAHIDRAQSAEGVHVGIASGDLNLIPLHTYTRSHFGFVGDAINMTARLMEVAGPGEIVISNSLRHELKPASRALFEELAPVAAKNIGLIKCWRWMKGDS